jgi:hypothetical protein
VITLITDESSLITDDRTLSYLRDREKLLFDHSLGFSMFARPSTRSIVYEGPALHENDKGVKKHF